jgi:hypothetical protein
MAKTLIGRDFDNREQTAGVGRASRACNGASRSISLLIFGIGRRRPIRKEALTNRTESGILFSRMIALEPPDKERTLALARRLFWWKTPEEALADRNRFLAQVMFLGTWKDIDEARHLWPTALFRDALRQAPPGVFDPRSCSYWHHMLDLLPVPPMPIRKLPQC